MSEDSTIRKINKVLESYKDYSKERLEEKRQTLIKIYDETKDLEDIYSRERTMTYNVIQSLNLMIAKK